jgi:hypothetical protein
MRSSKLSISRCYQATCASRAILIFVLTSRRELEVVIASWVVFQIILSSLMSFVAIFVDFTSTDELLWYLREMDEPSLSPNESSALRTKADTGHGCSLSPELRQCNLSDSDKRTPPAHSTIVTITHRASQSDSPPLKDTLKASGLV